MLHLRALHAFPWSLFLTPGLALAQSAEPIGPHEVYDSTRWGLGWLWFALLAVIIIALVAWGLSRDRTHRGPPLAH